MLQLAVEFYKTLFGEEDRLDINLDSDFWAPEDIVTEKENDFLDQPFTEELIKEDVFSSYAEGASRPDGFSFLFYQKFWDTIKGDLLNLVKDFDEGKADIFRLNFAMLTLIPKEPDATSLKKFRPIALTNCSFKFFCKSLHYQNGSMC